MTDDRPTRDGDLARIWLLCLGAVAVVAAAAFALWKVLP